MTIRTPVLKAFMPQRLRGARQQDRCVLTFATFIVFQTTLGFGIYGI